MATILHLLLHTTAYFPTKSCNTPANPRATVTKSITIIIVFHEHHVTGNVNSAVTQRVHRVHSRTYGFQHVNTDASLYRIRPWMELFEKTTLSITSTPLIRLRNQLLFRARHPTRISPNFVLRCSFDSPNEGTSHEKLYD